MYRSSTNNSYTSIKNRAFKSPTRCLKKVGNTFIPLKKPTLTSKLSLNPLLFTITCRDAMTYIMTYQDEGSLFFKTGTFVGMESDEDAAWHAKNYCDHYNCTLINVKKEDEA